MSEAIVDVDDLIIYRTDGIETGGVRESVLLPLKSVKGELIRCKYCKWWQDKTAYRDYPICVDYGREMKAEDFCSRAEKKW